MDGYLKQSTASQARTIGPFVDDTDFKTLKTALTIANTDIKLRANGTTLSNKNSGGGTHQANGEYSVTWDATDTANVGQLTYTVSVSGALVVRNTYFVLEEAVYDALFGASAPGYVANAPVNVAQINAVSTSSVTAVSANQGTTQPINFTGTGASALAKSDMVDIAGAAVSTSTAQLGVNAVNIGGTAQSARDIAASVLLSSGTGTGQVKLASGYVAPNWGDVGNPTTTLNLSGTTVKTATDIATQVTSALATILAAIEAVYPGWTRTTGSVVDDVGNNNQKFKTDFTETTQNHWKDCLIVFTSGALTNQIKRITAYSGVTKALTTTGFTSEPADGDDFFIVNV